MRVKVYPVEQKLFGPRKCDKNHCRVCKNVIESDTFQSFVDKKVCKINYRFTRSGQYLVYPCPEMYVVCNITVKLMTILDAGGIIVTIAIGNILRRS